MLNNLTVTVQNIDGSVNKFHDFDRVFVDYESNIVGEMQRGAYPSLTILELDGQWATFTVRRSDLD